VWAESGRGQPKMADGGGESTTPSLAYKILALKPTILLFIKNKNCDRVLECVCWSMSKRVF